MTKRVVLTVEEFRTGVQLPPAPPQNKPNLRRIIALINCPECNNQVSNQALKCPSCGKQLRKPKRTFMGKVFKCLFILFNVLMAIWLIGGVASSAYVINNTISNTERAGTLLGTGLGASIILTLWVIGDVILGLFVLLTRPKA